MPGDTARANGRLGGRPKGSLSKNTLEANKYKEILIAKIIANAEPLAEALIKKGLSGDIQALKEIHERSLGKVEDNMNIGGRFEISWANENQAIRTEEMAERDSQ